MSEPNTFAIRVITFGYSDSEDRLWLRLVIQDHADVQYWMTRRFLLRWISSMSECLFDTVQTGSFPAPFKPEDCVALEFIEARNNREPEAPPPPPEEDGENGPTLNRGLLNTIKINAARGGTSVIFSAMDSASYRLDLDRIASYHLLNGLIVQVDIAQWNRPDEAAAHAPYHNGATLELNNPVRSPSLRRDWSTPSFLQKFE